MEGTREIKSERLLMRRYRSSDAQILYEKFGIDPQMYEYSGWNPYASAEMAADTVEGFIRNYAKVDFYGWAIEYRGALIGTIGAYDYDPEKKTDRDRAEYRTELVGEGFCHRSADRGTEISYRARGDRIGHCLVCAGKYRLNESDVESRDDKNLFIGKRVESRRENIRPTVLPVFSFLTNSVMQKRLSLLT